MQKQKSLGSVIAIIFTPDKKKILLIKRRDVPMWALPGGGIDPDETSQQAVVREALEETGLEVRIVRQTALYSPLNKLTKETHVFECTPIDEGAALKLSPTDETLEAAFFPIGNLPTPFFFLHFDWLTDAQRHLPGMIRAPISQVTYWKLFLYFCKHPIQVLRLFLSRAGIPINRKDEKCRRD